MKYTAEEVRALAGDYLDASIVAEMLNDYADLLERIKANEGAVPVAMLRHFNCSGIARNGFSQEAQMLDGAPELPDGTELFTRPPAQEVQVDSANWFAGKYPTTAETAAQGRWGDESTPFNDWWDSHRAAHATNVHLKALAIAAWTASRTYHECATPSVPAESAQPTDSGRADLWVVFDEVASWLPYDGDDNRIRERFSEACAALAAQQAALAAQGQGEAVPDNIRDLLAYVYGMGAAHGHHYTVEGGYTAYTHNEWRDAYREAIDTAIDEDTETFAALPVLAKPVAQPAGVPEGWNSVVRDALAVLKDVAQFHGQLPVGIYQHIQPRLAALLATPSAPEGDA